MSRVHCVGCGFAVVVDPQGVCPEGHHVGARGARVEAAMGTATGHPDEPEPWVYRIDDTVHAGAGARSNGHQGDPPRELRPVRLPGLPTDGFEDVPADADALLRELHSLAALDEQVPPPPPPAAPTEEPEPSAGPPPVPGTPSRPPRLDRDAMYDAFAELSALDAFADELSGSTPARNGRTTSVARNGTSPGNGQATNGHRSSDAGAHGHAVNGQAVNGHAANGQPVNGLNGLNGHTVNGHASHRNDTDGAGQAHGATASGGPEPESTPDADELAALFSTELGPAPAPTEASAARPGPAAPGDQLDELFAAAVSTPKLRPRDRAAQEPAPTGTDAAPPEAGADPAPPSPAPTADQHATTGQPVPPTASETEAGSPPAPPAGLDLSSFTAKGGTGRKAGRKRLFGR